jgi:hypothetical protein
MLHNTGTADNAALTVDGAQPVWMTLNEARQRAFTGEVVFEADPEVYAYLDNGVVYYAERASDLSLGRRLLDAGVIDVAQLERGTVRVGDVEHLGRLFDRDPSVDRDAVVVLAEASTEALIAELANGAITTVRVTAYRHHPSGVHRWFVVPLDTPNVSRPVSAVTQLDTAVVDNLPGLSFAGAEADELTIEWDHQMGDIDPVASTPGFDTTPLDMAETATAPDTATAADTATADDLAGFDFSIVWPDGSEDRSTNDGLLTGHPTPAGPLAPPPADAAPMFTQLDAGGLHFEMPPLALSDEPALADAEVPDDVAAAVRRAIAAIESATAAAPHVAAPQAAPTSVAPQPEAIAQLPEIAEVAPIDEADRIDAIGTVEVAPPAGLGGFAPPTMATSAEVMYAQLVDDDLGIDSDLGGSLPEYEAKQSAANGVASVVFVDEPAHAEDADENDRSSALRRLIGGLRRKDH